MTPEEKEDLTALKHHMLSEVGIQFNSPFMGINYLAFVDEPPKPVTWAQKRRDELVGVWVVNRRKALKWRKRAIKWPVMFVAFVVGMAIATTLAWLMNSELVALMLGWSLYLSCQILSMEIDDRFPYSWEIDWRSHKSFEKVRRRNWKR